MINQREKEIVQEELDKFGETYKKHISKKLLTPLEALNDLIDYLEAEHYTLSENEEVVRRKQIIEAALKRLEKIDNTKLIIIGNPPPDESALNKLINQRRFVSDPQEMEIKPLYDETVDKKLKALEIIKERANLNITELSYDDEEYDLLKEVLL